jgi:hypothetical protein
MKVGITGHQDRDGIHWDWVRSAIGQEFASRQIEIAYSSLAVGSDQVFAEVALSQNVALVAVIPFEHYEQQFSLSDCQTYNFLLGRCNEVIALDWPGSRELAYMNAGRWIVNAVDIMFAVWDGKEARGMGGTANIVSFARSKGVPVVHVDPLGQTIRVIGTE